MSVFLIAGESVEKVTRLTSFACGVLQVTGKFVRSSNFFKWSSDRVLLKPAFFTSSDTPCRQYLSSTLWEPENPLVAAEKMGSFLEGVSRKAFAVISLSSWYRVLSSSWIVGTLLTSPVLNFQNVLDFHKWAGPVHGYPNYWEKQMTMNYCSSQLIGM